jgi:transcription initiation factor IIE alpha subunit
MTGKELSARMGEVSKCRIGALGYIELIGSLVRCPMTTEQLAKKSGLHKHTVSAVMRYLHRAKIIHRSSWVQPGPRRSMVPVWAIGADGDVSMPLYERRETSTRRPRSALVLIASIIEMLREMPMTRQDIADELKMVIDTVQPLVLAMRKAKLIYVASYRTEGRGRPAEEFAAGWKHDAPRPGLSPRADYHKIHRKRRRHAAMLNLTAGAMA